MIMRSSPSIFNSVPAHLANSKLIPLDVKAGDQLAVLVASAWTDRDDLALLGLFLGRVGDDDPACGLLLRVDAGNHDPIMQRYHLHIHNLLS